MRYSLVSCAIILQFLVFKPESFAQVKTVFPKQDEIVLVRTALGIATIVQVPQAIQSAVIGDQSGFKVEYLDKAVTIKPLRHGARTNLYLVTNAVRYTLRLATVDQNGADYIVYVKDRPAPSNTYRTYSKVISGKLMTLKIERVGRTTDGLLLLDAMINSKLQKRIKPEDIWIVQDGKARIINSLYMSNTFVGSITPVRLGLSVSKSDLIANRPMNIEVRHPETLLVQVPSEVLWQ